MPSCMIMVMVVVIVLVDLQESRLDVEDAVEIEGVAAEHVVDRHVAARASCAAWHRG